VTAVKERRRQLLYGRRKGPKLSARQARLRDELLPALALQIEKARDPRGCFPAPVDDVWLEVGTGAGEHLFWQASRHPSVGIIGAEPYESGVAKFLSRLAEDGGSLDAPAPPGNIRIHEGDARDVIAALPDACLGRVFILFPDPWPKTRHHKRRFIQSEMLDSFARIMRSGAELRFSTDDRGYLVWTLERLCAHEDFLWTAERATDWTDRPADWPQTRYEAKALHGPPVHLRFLRR
jgi:tRNA (guanine-N7-)-methyltransferase